VLLTPACAAPHGDHAAGRVHSNPFVRDQGGIVRGDVRQRRLALIFTGGEHGEGTGHILDTLARCGAKASFFVTGDYLARAAHRPFLRRIVAEGHYLGPHSHAHPVYCAWEDRNLTRVTRRVFERDLQRNIDALQTWGACPHGSPIYFVPPYEWYNAEQVAWATDMGVTLINFTPGSGSNRDWIPEGQPGFVPSETIIRDILAQENRDPHGLNGNLLLLHLGAQRVDKVHFRLGELIEPLRARGYDFVTVEALLGAHHPPG